MKTEPEDPVQSPSKTPQNTEAQNHSMLAQPVGAWEFADRRNLERHFQILIQLKSIEAVMTSSETAKLSQTDEKKLNL